MSEPLKLSSPWITYYKKVYTLFDGDPEVAVMYDDDEKKLTLLVDNEIKANALSELLPSEKSFGSVMVTIEVVPSNESQTIESLVRNAFTGNPILSEIQTVEGVFTNPICYVVFKPSIAQFWNDDLSDLNGVCTMLHQDIAKEVFDGNEGLFFCTDLLDEE